MTGPRSLDARMAGKYARDRYADKKLQAIVREAFLAGWDARDRQLQPVRVSVEKQASPALREWEDQVQAGMICWYCTSPAVVTLVAASEEKVYRDGRWGTEMVHKPVCGPDGCRYGYDKGPVRAVPEIRREKDDAAHDSDSAGR